MSIFLNFDSTKKFELLTKYLLGLKLTQIHSRPLDMKIWCLGSLSENKLPLCKKEKRKKPMACKV